MDNEMLERIGKHLAYLLRHHPESAGLDMDGHGWVCVDDLIEGVNEYSPFFLDYDILDAVVANDDKQRYAYSDDKAYIRANQGHSVNVDVGLEEAVPPDVLWHGTAVQFVDAIEQEGLLPQSRLYVHLSEDLETAITVGQRHGSPFVFEVDTRTMHDDGYVFLISKNGVWLTDNVPPEYLSRYDLN